MRGTIGMCHTMHETLMNAPVNSKTPLLVFHAPFTPAVVQWAFLYSLHGANALILGFGSGNHAGAPGQALP